MVVLKSKDDLQHYSEILDLPLVDFTDWRLSNTKPYNVQSNGIECQLGVEGRSMQINVAKVQSLIGLPEYWFRIYLVEIENGGYKDCVIQGKGARFNLQEGPSLV